ncbi:MAG TPA: 4-(cytidine 5'-diphospho)-2-C-methyl-D-erythritol kinase [Acidimicrobiia bacterium]|jgi:4-diphosphocytidyl-2-C-methyl-D-erythritol kinase|nr:4-(cytidine 5'-diphospho)-2-C-methyl-D-erythritol kinase [Acidimicrobiia bacterium]
MRAEAFAKVTLSLRITGVHADGYHEIDAVMVTVSEPHDILEIEPSATTSLEIDGEFAVPADASNLVWRALDALGVRAAVRLHKRIPAGAGLGGGSADAAAVLRVFGGSEVVGAQLGADVPFCMRGGAARVRGIGEQIEPIERLEQHLVIATPRFGCVTADVYRAWDELGGPHGEPNDLEPAAHRVEPRLVEFKRAVEDAAGQAAILAGSGSSYVVVFDDGVQAAAARQRVAEAIDGWTWLGTTCPAGDAANGSS